jgi:hypothetical protein
MTRCYVLLCTFVYYRFEIYVAARLRLFRLSSVKRKRKRNKNTAYRYFQPSSYHLSSERIGG